VATNAVAPLRGERGLKHTDQAGRRAPEGRSPSRGARIETSTRRRRCTAGRVAPLRGERGLKRLPGRVAGRRPAVAPLRGERGLKPRYRRGDAGKNPSLPFAGSAD